MGRQKDYWLITETDDKWNYDEGDRTSQFKFWKSGHPNNDGKGVL